MIGSNIIFLPEVDSTNNYIAKLISEGNIGHGTVILAEKQTAGRGQRGNTWRTSSENQFTASIYLSTAFLSVHHAPYLNKALAVGVAQTVKGILGESVRLKWPNDILVKDKKLGGILIEGNIKNQQLEYVVFGLGINLKKEEAVERSTSVEDFDFHLSPFEFLTFLLPKIQLQFERCQKFEFKGIQQEYLDFLWRLNEDQLISESGGETFMGRIVNVDETGSVVIESMNEVKSYGLQEVRFSYE